MKATLLLVLVSLSTCSIIAQEQPNSLPPKIDITTEYDRFKDVTTVSVKPQVVTLTNAGQQVRHLTIGALFGYPGRELHTRPSSIFLTFGVISDTFTVSRDYKPSLIVLADGKKAFEGLASNTDRGALESGRVFEVFAAEVSVSMLEKIAAAKLVEMQLAV